MSNTINWFDLPVINLQRAINFYHRVLNVDISEEFPGVAVISHQQNDVAGCLYVSDTYQPSIHGALLYFNVTGRLKEAIATAEEHGATIEQPLHPIGPHGYRSILIDCEGNRVALHSE